MYAADDVDTSSPVRWIPTLNSTARTECFSDGVNSYASDQSEPSSWKIFAVFLSGEERFTLPKNNG